MIRMIIWSLLAFASGQANYPITVQTPGHPVILPSREEIIARYNAIKEENARRRRSIEEKQAKVHTKMMKKNKELHDEMCKKIPYVFKEPSDMAEKNDKCCDGVANYLRRGYRDKFVVEDTRTNNPSRFQCKLAETTVRFRTKVGYCGNPSDTGECVEWADGRYFQLTMSSGQRGHAANWTFYAEKDPDWVISTFPVFPSIAVYPATDRSPYGHVAIVESIFKNGTFCQSEWKAPNRRELTTKITRHGKAKYIYRKGTVKDIIKKCYWTNPISCSGDPYSRSRNRSS